MHINTHHIWKSLLLAVVFGTMVLAVTGNADIVIEHMGMGMVKDANQSYLETAFDRSLAGFLVLSGIKSGLAIIEGSEVGIGFNLEIGDIVQSVYDYVDIAWKTALAGGTVLLMTRLCLEAVALVDHWCLAVTMLSVGVFLVLSWFFPQLERTMRMARESTVFVVVVSLSLYIILPISISGASFLSKSISQPIIEATQDGFDEINRTFSTGNIHSNLFPHQTEDESLFSSLDFKARFEKTRERIKTIGEYFKNRTRHIALLTLKLVAGYLFDCIVFPLTFLVVVYLFAKFFMRLCAQPSIESSQRRGWHEES